MKKLSIATSSMLFLGLTSLSTIANCAPALQIRDVIAHCSAELEAMSPGAAAKTQAMSNAELAKIDASDQMMQMLNASDMTADLLQSLIQSTRDDKYDPYDTSKEKSAAQLAEDAFEICRWQVRLDQLNGKNVSSPNPPDTATSSTSNLDNNLNPAQIEACSNDIKTMQVQSQSWPGDVNDVALRLGQYQKDMFEGRCAGHPEAQAYINSANRMLGYQAAAGSSGSAASNSSGATPGKTKQSHVPSAVATQCLSLKPGGGVNNNCNFAIEYVYCVSKPAPGSWAASFDCEQGKTGNWQIGPLGTAIMQTSGERVQFFGCKYGPTLSKPDGISPADFRYSPSASGMPTGRCKEWGAP
ncbi:MAG: hypothetical protein ABI644_06505 [Arenimonas sp.]